MKQSLSENRWILLFVAGAILFLIGGIRIGVPQLAVAGILLLAGMLWLQTNLSSVDFDPYSIHITHKGKTISLPLHKVEWISEVRGGTMSLCFLGFKSPTIFGARVVFLTFPFRRSVDDLVETTRRQGVEIKVNRLF